MRVDLPTSSAISCVEYDLESGALVVWFRSGEKIVYEHVAQQIYSQLIGAESAGEFFNTQIRDSHSYRPLDEDE